ncbi:MAG TPA: pitrilysin family protein [Bryobacteraceae bacterium]|nr:pitrilysin family protein [Bryobacteraceae bacterium]
MKKLMIAGLSMIAVGFAQDSDAPNGSFRGMVRLNRAPVSNEVLHVKLPRPVEKQLSNGMRLLIIESNRTPSVTLTISIPSSHLRDPKDMPGLAEATAALMEMGTTTRSARQIADDLADIGASLNISVGAGGGGGRGGPGGAIRGDSGTITLTSLSENFDAALAILADVLLHPSFPAAELDKWKSRQKSTIEQGRTSPNVLANELLFRTLYPGDARSVTRATLDSLNRITRESILEHYKAYYVPSGELAGIAGEIKPPEAVAKLDKALGAWKGGPVARVSLPIEPPVAEKKVYLISRPNSVQTYLVLANRAIDRTSPDYIACMVMNQVLGSGPAARLFRIIREEKGYTYGISSGFSATRYQQHFSSSTSVRTEVTEPALTDVLKEFREIRETPVSKDELDGAKRALVANFALGLENPTGVLARWMQQREYGLPENYWDTYSEKVMAITADDVQRVAKKYVPYDNVQIVAVGDGAKIGELLKKFGPVETISPDTN